MPIPHTVVPPANGTTSTWQIGSYNAVTDQWTLVLDLNDRATWFVKSYDIAQPEKVVSRSGNPRTAGERITNERYKNRYITLTLQLRSTTTLAAIDTAIHGLEAALSTTPFMLRLAEAQAAQYSYAIVKSWVHNIPQDPLQRLAKVKTGITLIFECEPGLLGDKLYLDNLIVDPGFEAPSGPGVQVFSDSFATTNAYALQTGGAPTLNPNNTFVDVVNANGGANLLRYYRLGESSGTTAIDISGMAQHGTYSATGITLGVAGLLSGDSDTCATFASASSGKVTAPAAGLPTGNGAMTILAWIKFAANPASNGVVGYYGGTTAKSGLSLYLDTTGKLNCDVLGGTGTVTSAAALSTGVAHLAAVTWDGTTLTLYADGASTGTPTTPGALSMTATNCIIGDNTATSYFNGQIDEVGFYNTALTSTQISNLYTAGHTGATGTLSNAMSIPSGGQVAFGSPAWGALNQWQVRFRWVTGLTAQFYLHLTDGNNNLRASVTTGTNGFALIHKIGGVFNNLAQSSPTLTHEAWYWLQVTQFPTVPGNAPYVQAALFYDDNGIAGSAVTNGALGPVQTQDAVTALSGRPQLIASGAALAIGGNFTGVHTVSLFGPGGWGFTPNFSGMTGQTSGAWEQNTANTYPSGPVTSYGAARIDCPPAGTVDARWQTWDGSGGATGAAQFGIPTAQNHVLGVSVAYKTTAGLSATSFVRVVFREVNSSGTELVANAQAILSGTTATSWATYSGTYTVTQAATACVRVQLQVTDTTANSANATVWFDNVQLWDQTTTGQTSMPYCELRFPQSPAQLLVSGLVGDLPVPATLSFGTYVGGSISNPATFTYLIGRRSYATSGPQLVGILTDALGASVGTNIPVLSISAYGGMHMKWTPANSSDTYTPKIFSGRPADYQGYNALLLRMQSSETSGTNIGKVTVTAYAGMQNAPWEQSTVVYDSYATAAVAGLTTQNAWAIVNAGVFPTPGFARSLATDLTQNYQAVQLSLADSNTTPTAMLINWCALLPNDGMTLRGQIIYNGNAVFGAINAWNWYYLDASQSAVGIVPTTGFSTEATALPNISHAAGGAGVPPNSSPNGAISVIPTGNAYLTLDPSPPPNALSVNGVNQLAAILADGTNAVLSLAASLSYTPQYLDPR